MNKKEIRVIYEDKNVVRTLILRNINGNDFEKIKKIKFLKNKIKNEHYIGKVKKPKFVYTGEGFDYNPCKICFFNFKVKVLKFIIKNRMLISLVLFVIAVITSVFYLGSSVTFDIGMFQGFRG